MPQLRVGGHLGRDGELGGRERHALGPGAVLGTQALTLQSTAGARRSPGRRDRCVQGGRAGRRPPAHTGLDLSRHESRRAPGRRERGRLRLRQRREHHTGDADAGPPGQLVRVPHQEFHPRRPVRARRSDGRRAVVVRHPDHVLEPLGRPVGCQRPRLPGHVRWDVVLLRHRPMRASPFMAVVTAGVALVGAGADSARAQDWTTAGYDAQRSSWVRAEGKISAATLRRPGFQLLWKLEVADPSTAERALTPPVLLDLVIGYRGFRALAFVAASSDHVVAIDTDLGRVEWERQFAPGAPSTGGLPACVREVTPNLARPTNAALPILIGGAGSRTRQPARGAVGEPGEGAVTLAPLVARRPEAPAPAAPRPPAPRPTPRPFPIVYVLSTDGMLHTLNVMNGADAEPPVPFLPPHANARGLIVVDTVAYVTTSDGHLVVLEPRTLKPRATYRSGGPAFSSSPVIFDRGGRLLIAASSRDGRIRLLDSRRKPQPMRSRAGPTRTTPTGS